MSDEQYDSDGNRSFRKANRAISRRTALGVGGAVSAAGLLALLTGVDISRLFGGDETASESDGPDDSVWLLEGEAHRQMVENRPTLRPSFEYEPVAVRAGPGDSRISAIAAEPAAEGSGDRVLVTAEESWISNFETLLVARFTTGERVATGEITIEGRSVVVRIFNRGDLWMGVARYEPPDARGVADILLARSTSRERLQEIIEEYPSKYQELRPL